MNVVCLSGRLETAPKVRTTKTGKEVAEFAITVAHPFFDQSSVFQCTAWRKACETAKTLQVGDLVAISGNLEQRKFNDREVIGVSVDRLEVLVKGGGSDNRDVPDQEDPWAGE